MGAEPVGLIAAYVAVHRGASNVYVVDHVEQRLENAASIGAIPINFVASDPVERILAYEPSGVVRSVDCVGGEALNVNLTIEEDILVRQAFRLLLSTLSQMNRKRNAYTSTRTSASGDSARSISNPSR